MRNCVLYVNDWTSNDKRFWYFLILNIFWKNMWRHNHALPNIQKIAQKRVSRFLTHCVEILIVIWIFYLVKMNIYLALLFKPVVITSKNVGGQQQIMIMNWKSIVVKTLRFHLRFEARNFLCLGGFLSFHLLSKESASNKKKWFVQCRWTRNVSAKFPLANMR